ncbi:unnamed protein product [Litomosoides sigmodontis]|uniref:F5/8 type C domain-containing protein n=1 Tax=Litomosoides sigmodontis TaxID=42156 RepID=A0A3P6T331_LITSI|nr:unnamed protein product [Litomosoides sigmodontis]
MRYESLVSNCLLLAADVYAEFWGSCDEEWKSFRLLPTNERVVVGGGCICAQCVRCEILNIELDELQAYPVVLVCAFRF